MPLLLLLFFLRNTPSSGGDISIGGYVGRAGGGGITIALADRDLPAATSLALAANRFRAHLTLAKQHHFIVFILIVFLLRAGLGGLRQHHSFV